MARTPPLVALVLLLLSASGAPAQPPSPTASASAARRPTTLDALRQFPGFYHLQSIVVRGELVESGSRVVIRADEQEMRVVVADGDSVRSGPSVLAAVGVAPSNVTLPPATPEEFRARVEGHYRLMREALARGDWSAFGEAYEALGRLLRGARP